MLLEEARYDNAEDCLYCSGRLSDFEFENGEMTCFELMPISLGYGEPPWRSGNPRFCTDYGIIEYFAKLSAPFGTEIVVDARGMGIVKR